MNNQMTRIVRNCSVLQLLATHYIDTAFTKLMVILGLQFLTAMAALEIAFVVLNPLWPKSAELHLNA